MRPYLTAFASCFIAFTSPAASSWWNADVDQAVDHAGTNRDQITHALENTPADRREGMAFLVTNMPNFDLTSLSSDYLLHQLKLHYDGFEKAPWRNSIPHDIFLNDVLPYANINETRDDSADALTEKKCAALVADCQTPSAAAQRLNQKLFDLVNVHYNTHRPKSTQSPLESMRCNMATCTGLSIMLADACRLVGVPARLAGIPNWIDNRGNHTWVEIWDGDWHFLGASEPDPKGLDNAWFVHDASLARADQREHSIYAASFRKTGLAYPLDWGVSVINVTDRYAHHEEAQPDHDRLLVTVVDKIGGHRIAARVTVTPLTNAPMCIAGTSRDDQTDLNSALAFNLPLGLYDVRAEYNGLVANREFNAGTNRETSITISMADTPLYTLPAWATNYTPQPVTPLSTADADAVSSALERYFAAAPTEQQSWRFDKRLDDLLARNEPAVRQLAWEAYKSAPIHDGAHRDFASNTVRFDSYVSPYTVKTVGTHPPHGWGLFIAMHGGGNTPKAVNDSQWRIMQRYYRDQPQLPGYRYVALRAPNDTWNGFYDVYAYPLIDNLIRQFVLDGDVDPDKVFIMGYSHGGYGAFAIGPKEPDLFAAIHVSAGAPTDGETTSKTLRHTPFTLMVGELDTDYGRVDRDRKFRDAIAQLRGDRDDIYPVTVKIMPGNHHGGLPDRGMIAYMDDAVRDPVPRDLTWLMTDRVITDYFWLHTDAPGKEQEIDASIANNRITVNTTNILSGSVMLDTRLVDFSHPVTLALNGAVSTFQVQPSLRVLAQTLLRRGDPELAFTAEIPLVFPLPAP